MPVCADDASRGIEGDIVVGIEIPVGVTLGKDTPRSYQTRCLPHRRYERMKVRVGDELEISPRASWKEARILPSGEVVARSSVKVMSRLLGSSGPSPLAARQARGELLVSPMVAIKLPVRSLLIDDIDRTRRGHGRGILVDMLEHPVARDELGPGRSAPGRRKGHALSARTTRGARLAQVVAHHGRALPDSPSSDRHHTARPGRLDRVLLLWVGLGLGLRGRLGLLLRRGRSLESCSSGRLFSSFSSSSCSSRMMTWPASSGSSSGPCHRRWRPGSAGPAGPTHTTNDSRTSGAAASAFSAPLGSIWLSSSRARPPDSMRPGAPLEMT